MRTSFLLLPILVALPAALPAQGVPGRWDLTATDGTAIWPMWLELVAGPPVAGRLQGRFGHALSLAGVVVEGSTVTFPMPSERPVAEPPRFTASITGDRLAGAIVRSDGTRVPVTGVRAPSLDRARAPEWGEPVDLLAGGLAGWRPRQESGPNGWSLADGVLTNTPPSVDLVSRDTFTDFRLELDVNVPPRGNSGVYLRGRYEVQVQDDHGQEPGNRRMGGIYGQVAPTSLPTKPAGEWQRLDITLVGRTVTVVLNGVTIIARQEIPGLTGGALDSDEGAPGPIMLQGDHSGVQFRNIRLTPAR